MLIVCQESQKRLQYVYRNLVKIVDRQNLLQHNDRLSFLTLLKYNDQNNVHFYCKTNRDLDKPQFLWRRLHLLKLASYTFLAPQVLALRFYTKLDLAEKSYHFQPNLFEKYLNADDDVPVYFRHRK